MSELGEIFKALRKDRRDQRQPSRMNRIIGTEEHIKIALDVIEKQLESKTCRTCKHRQRFELHYNSRKVVQCCMMQISRRSNSGYKTIKVTDKACGYYQPKQKGGEL